MPPRPLKDIHIDELLETALDAGANALHLRSYAPPLLAFANGDLVPADYQAASAIEIQQLVYGLLTDDEIRKFEREELLNFTFTLQRRGEIFAKISRWGNTMQAVFTVTTGQRVTPLI